MPTDTNVDSLVINKLTKAQYDDIQSPSETELYLVEESIDTTPTNGSDNPVSSGGVYTALQGKADTSSLATVATSGSYNDLSNKPTIPTVPTNVSAFTNDAGYITGYIETDPTVPSWAKAASKPSYTASEVGALPDTTVIPTESTVSGWGFTKNAGTVTSVTVNGSTYSPTNGDVDLGTIGGGGGNVSSTTINTIVTLTEAQYTALATKDSSTLYIITA